MKALNSLIILIIKDIFHQLNFQMKIKLKKIIKNLINKIF